MAESEEPFIARQRLGKRVPAATDTNATTEELLETMFSLQAVPKLVMAY
jgi:hypothetical protein